MNIQSIISSGILEAYVMNELSPKEMQRVKMLAELSNEVREELEKIEIAYLQIASDLAVNPPAHIKNGLMDHINREINSPKQAQKEVYQSSSNFWKIAAVISLLATFAFIILWLQTNNHLDNARETIISLQTEQQRLATILENSNRTILKNEEQFATMAQPATKVIDLKGTPYMTEASVKLYWNPEQENVLVSLTNLPDLPEGSQYQLWFLLDGQPYDAGLIESGIFTQNMKNVSRADAFAITIEPMGGSQSPTLEKLVAIGVVG